MSNGRNRTGLSQHILPTAGTMIGICTTLIGLVKVVEGRIGPTRVDEFAGLLAIAFLVGALSSYGAMRTEGTLSLRLERLADLCFVSGLAGLTLLSLVFAYEIV